MHPGSAPYHPTTGANQRRPRFAPGADDGQDSHVTEPIEYALESIYATATSGMQVLVHNRALEEAVRKHPLMRKERQREDDDVTFVGGLPEAPWSQNVVSMLRDRAQAQEMLLGTMR